MELHEIYEVLLRRGMPTVTGHTNDAGEHWGLKNDRMGGWTYWDGETFGGNDVHPDDARDLITMHALRWVNALGFSIGTIGNAVNALEGIVELTAHLEPKA